MSDALNSERRRSHRVDAVLNLNLHLQLGPDGEPTELETINVSSTGMYFRSNHYVEPMTKLSLTFDVNVRENDAPTPKPVACEGIVARVVPELPGEAVDGYEVAVFFTTIDAESLHHLERYIDARLSV